LIGLPACNEEIALPRLLARMNEAKKINRFSVEMRTEAYKEANLEVFAIPRPIILQSIVTGKPMLIHSHCLAAIGLAVIQRRIHTMAHQVAP
jgi:hypothetical protein